MWFHPVKFSKENTKSVQAICIIWNIVASSWLLFSNFTSSESVALFELAVDL